MINWREKKGDKLLAKNTFKNSIIRLKINRGNSMTGSKSPRGEYAAAQLRKRRKKFRWKDKNYTRRMLRLKQRFD
ncbi:MAG: hypothetical protein ACTSRU_06295, partial [Candidatus Hodarchaeales archaeon]